MDRVADRRRGPVLHRQLTDRMGRERASYGIDEVDAAGLARLALAYDQRMLFSDDAFPLSGATS
jgi:hypothetical protein